MPDPVRWFYPMTGVLLVALTVWGFRHFFLHGQSHPGRPITPPIRTLIIIHGVAMTLWMLLFTLQPWLVATRRVKTHMNLGRLGMVIAAAVLVLGVMIGVSSARVTPPEVRIWGLPAKQFMAVPVISVLAFAGFVAAAVIKRRRSAIHRPMMLCATLAIMGAAVSRIDLFSNLYIGTVWERAFGPFFSTLVLAIVLLALRCALTRAFDRWLALGVALLIGVSYFIMKIAPTGVWDSLASIVVK